MRALEVLSICVRCWCCNSVWQQFFFTPPVQAAMPFLVTPLVTFLNGLSCAETPNPLPSNAAETARCKAAGQCKGGCPTPGFREIQSDLGRECLRVRAQKRKTSATLLRSNCTTTRMGVMCIISLGGARQRDGVVHHVRADADARRCDAMHLVPLDSIVREPLIEISYTTAGQAREGEHRGVPGVPPLCALRWCHLRGADNSDCIGRKSTCLLVRSRNLAHLQQHRPPVLLCSRLPHGNVLVDTPFPHPPAPCFRSEFPRQCGCLGACDIFLRNTLHF